MINQIPSDLRMIAWEVTRACNLSCIHCRADAQEKSYDGELSTEECILLLEDIGREGKPMILLTGGDPMMREDIYDIIQAGNKAGLRMVIAPNGTLINAKNARLLKETGIQRVSISIDGSDNEKHDRIRCVPGTFDRIMEGIQYLREAGLPFQINTTVINDNVSDLPNIMNLAIRLEAAAHHIFFIVPTGRGKNLPSLYIDPVMCEDCLRWIAKKTSEVPLHIKVTCAPHFQRVMRQDHREPLLSAHSHHSPLDATSRGCLGGISFCFISHVGEVAPCGYLEISAGSVKKDSLSHIWENSPFFQKLRNLELLKGRCGICEFKGICGGCRARAYGSFGDFMEEEPFCSYIPRRKSH